MPTPNGLPAGWSTLPPGWSAGPPSGGAAPAPDITANPNGEGTYKMVGPDGKTIGVPFSKVSSASGSGYTIDPSDKDRFHGDDDASRSAVTRLANWGNKTFAHQDAKVSPEHPAANFDSGLEEVLRPGGNIINAGVRSLLGVPEAARDAVVNLPRHLNPMRMMQDSAQDMQDRAAAANHPYDPATGTGVLQPGQRPNQPTSANLEHLATDTAGGLGAGYLMGEGVSHGLKLPGVAKDFVTGDVNKTIPGANVSPLQRYNQAKNLGVQFDAADATNSPLLGNVKRVGEHSLFGGHVYDASKLGNTTSLTSSMDDFLNGLYSGDREAGGTDIQNALRADHARLHESAQSGFQTLSDATGNKPLPGAANVGMAAKRILTEQAPYFDRFPSLRPAKTMSVIEDVSDLSPQDPTTRKLDKPTPADFSTMHRLGSDLHNLSSENPDLVKTRAQSWVQRLEGENGAAIRDSGEALTPELRPIFDQAHGDWADMKGTYDNPSSPFYHAVRTTDPSTLFKGIGQRTPEGARNLLQRLTPPGETSVGPAAGAVRRGTVENALKPTAEGVPNFKNFPLQLNRIPADYRAELFSPGQNETLRDFSNTSNVVGKDFNPSGSAKQGQKFAEAAAFIPTAGLPALQYPLAKAMTSPTLTDWLMKPSKLPNPLVAPAAGAATYEAGKKKR